VSPVPPDAGLHAERTALAWHRTAVSGCAVAGSVVVAAAHLAPSWVLVVVWVLAALCAGAVTLASARWASGSIWVHVLAAAVVPVLLAVAGLVFTLTPV
jgi:hypothetical protein